jgi:hypothetical protein
MLSNFIADLRATTKPSEKQEVVRKYESDFLKQLMVATYEPFVQLHIKLKKSEIPEPGGLDLVEMEGRGHGGANILPSV